LQPRPYHPKKDAEAQETFKNSFASLVIEALPTSAGKRGKSVGTPEPHAPNVSDHRGNRNNSIGTGANQAGRNRALT
jgi:hypothetical protein